LKQYLDTQPSNLDLTIDFLNGYNKGFYQGFKESGSNWVQIARELKRDPIKTIDLVCETFRDLSNLALSDQWEELSEALSPEACQLARKWPSLSAIERGKLAGYAIGKFGTDIFIAGGVAKLASKGVKGANKLLNISNSLQKVEGVLSLEGATAERGIKISEAITANHEIVQAAEKLGFTSQEISNLLNKNVVENTVKVSAKDFINLVEEFGFTKHSIERAIERNISKETICEALVNPLKIEEIKIDNFGRPSQRYIGKGSEVVINPETKQVVSVNPTSSKKLERLHQEALNVNSQAE
jgi:hypothetical protein